jgi:hypothetical protein
MFSRRTDVYPASELARSPSAGVLVPDELVELVDVEERESWGERREPNASSLNGGMSWRWNPEAGL